MRTRITTVGLAAALVVSLVTLAIAWRSPGNNQGYEPIQPIAFSHKLHAGAMEISCVYCHLGVETSRYAGLPALSTCMNCHKTVTASLDQQKANISESPELRKLYDALALDKALKPVPGQLQKPIAWQRVHQLPDFVYFDHRAHVSAGLPCQSCHGPIDNMDRVRQVETLAMGWCVNCHRQSTANGVGAKPVHASTDCVTCHY
jgi:hypothetical protein